MPSRNCGNKEEVLQSLFLMSAFARSYERVVYVIRYTFQNDGIAEGMICR